MANEIKEPEFRDRLCKACDANPNCPPMHYGRLVWIKDEFLARFKISVSLETVRKWNAGESRPRAKFMKVLAALLSVDESWLALGVNADVPDKERRIRNAMADGLVNLLAGLIQLDGGHPAFPEPGDKPGRDQAPDLHAIIKGASYVIHVISGEQVDDDAPVRVVIPLGCEHLTVIAIVRISSFDFDIYEVNFEDAKAIGEIKKGAIEASVPVSKLKKIESFAARF